MSNSDLPLDTSDLRLDALSRWVNEGGTKLDVSQEMQADSPEMTNAELVLLRVRVISLENLLIAVLAEGSDQQRETAREIAEIISPRADATQHSLTIRAAQHMTDIVDRADHIRARQTPRP